MALTSTQTPAQKFQQQLQAQRLQNAKLQSGEGLNGSAGSGNGETTHDAWNNYYANLGNPFLKPKLEDIKIEIPLSVQVPAQEAPELVQKELQYEQKEIDYDEGQVLEAVHELNQAHEFSAFGSLNLDQFFDSAHDKSTDYNVSSREAQTEIHQLTSEPSESDTLIEDEHTQKPLEFTENNIDLVRHHSDLDFPYFFGWVRSWSEPKAENAIQFLSKIFGMIFKTTKKIYKGIKTHIWDEIIWKQVFGIRKKEPSKEEKEKKMKEAANKRMFFEALKATLARVISEQRRLAMKSRLEKLNRSLKRSNLSYEGDLNEAGQINEAALLEEELANSKMNEQQLLAEKRKKLMMAGQAKTKKGPGITFSADKSHNFNNAAKLAG